MLLAQVRRLLVEHELERGPDVGAEQVAAARLAVRAADDDVRMDGGLAVLERDVAGHGQDLDLLVERDLSVALGLPVKPAEDDVAERPDRREARRADLPLVAPGAQLLHHLVALGEDQHDSAPVLAA